MKNEKLLEKRSDEFNEQLIVELNKEVRNGFDPVLDTVMNEDDEYRIEKRVKEKVIANHPELTPEEKEVINDGIDHLCGFVDAGNCMLENGYISNDNCPHIYISINHINDLAKDYWKNLDTEELLEMYDDTPVEDFVEYIERQVGRDTYKDRYKKVYDDNYGSFYDAVEGNKPEEI